MKGSWRWFSGGSPRDRGWEPPCSRVKGRSFCLRVHLLLSYLRLPRCLRLCSASLGSLAFTPPIARQSCGPGSRGWRQREGSGGRWSSTHSSSDCSGGGGGGRHSVRHDTSSLTAASTALTCPPTAHASSTSHKGIPRIPGPPAHFKTVLDGPDGRSERGDEPGGTEGGRRGELTGSDAFQARPDSGKFSSPFEPFKAYRSNRKVAIFISHFWRQVGSHVTSFNNVLVFRSTDSR